MFSAVFYCRKKWSFRLYSILIMGLDAIGCENSFLFATFLLFSVWPEAKKKKSFWLPLTSKRTQKCFLFRRISQRQKKNEKEFLSASHFWYELRNLYSLLFFFTFYFHFATYLRDKKFSMRSLTKRKRQSQSAAVSSFY